MTFGDVSRRDRYALTELGHNGAIHGVRMFSLEYPHDQWLAISQSANGRGDAEVSAIPVQLRGLRQALSTPERWLHLHNLRVRRSRRDLRAFARYLRAMAAPVPAAHAGAQEPWLCGVEGAWLSGLVFEPPAPRELGGPLVSVLLVARNARATLQDAIDSLLEQSHQNLEILVGDDGSSDGTSSLVTNLYRDHPRVRLVRCAGQRGAHEIVQDLLEHAAGAYVTTQDASALALPTRIGAQLRAALEPGRRGSLCCALSLRADGRVVFSSDGTARTPLRASLLVRREDLLELGGRAGAAGSVHAWIVAKHGDHALPVLETPLLLVGESVGHAPETRPLRCREALDW